MKLRIPHKLIKALIASFAFAFTAQTLRAQSTLNDWEKGSEALNTADATVFNTWTKNSPSELRQIPSGSTALIPEGSTDLMPDGLTSISSYYAGKWINSEGYLTEADGTIIRDADGKGRFIEHNLILGDDMVWTAYSTSYSLPAGTIMIGNYLASWNSPYAKEYYTASDFSTHDTKTGTSIKIDTELGHDTRSYFLGKYQAQTGSSTVPTENEMIIQHSGTSTDSDIYAVSGGNMAYYDSDSSGSLPASKEAHFYGDSTIIFRDTSKTIGIVGGNMLDYIENESNTSNMHANYIGSTQISMQEDSVADVVIGGNFIAAQSAGSTATEARADFGTASDTVSRSSTIIVHEQSSAERIIGGNSGNNQASSFYGDSSIIVDTTGVVAHVVGANYLNASFDSAFEGNTSISITQNMGAYDEGIGGHLTPSLGVIGGFTGDYGYQGAYRDFQGKTATLRAGADDVGGNTSVVIDFTDASTQTGEFQMSVIGGSAAGNGMNVIQEGTATVTFNNLGNTLMKKAVIGGNLNIDSDYIEEEDGVEILVEKNDQSFTKIDHVNVTVNSGNFAATNAAEEYYNPLDLGNMFIVGSLSAGGGQVETGSTEATITGGVFGILVGGNAATAGQIDRQPEGYRINTLPSVYTKSEYTDTSTGRLIMSGEDGVVMNVSGASTSSSTLVAGSYINNDVTAIVGDNNEIDQQALIQGDIQLNITGGTHSVVTGGSYIGSHIASANIADTGEPASGYKAEQGRITVSVTGGTINSDYLAAAGIINLASGEPSPEIANHYIAGFIAAANEFSEAGNIVNPTEWNPSTAPSASPVLMEMKTDSTQIELGQNVEFSQNITISGDYQYNSAGGSAYSDIILNPFLRPDDPPEYISLSEFFSNILLNPDMEALHPLATAWSEAYHTEMAEAPKGEFLTNSSVVDNRELLLSEAGNYENLGKATFTEFDEVDIAAGATVSVAKQDLDLLNGRNQLDAGSTRVTFDSEGTALMTGENTVRKTGDGTLILGENNGQTNKVSADAESNLQLVVEAGTVVLAKESAATSKSDFKTLAVQSGATLDMRAGNYDETTGEYISGNAGINGDLRLEMDSILLVDASRDTLGSGTALEGGTVQIIGEGQVTLQFDNLDLVQKNQTAEDGHLLFEAGSQYFEIVLFSELDFLDALSTNILFDLTGGTFDGVAAKGVLASKYFKSNLDLTDVYLVYHANGDMVLTGGDIAVPEPSSATLSLLALAGLLARRRRKTV